MNTYLIDPRNTTKPYNFCLLSTLKKKKYPFDFLGYIPRDWREKSPIKENNLFLPLSRGIFENKKTQRFIANLTQTPEIFFGHLRLRGKLKKNTILHFLWFTVPSIEKYIIPHLGNAKILYTAHNLLPHREHPRDLQNLKKLYSCMQKIIVHDNETKNKFYEIFNIPVSVTTIPHGNAEIFYNTFDRTTDLDSKNFYSKMFPRLKRPIFLFMGPIKKYKGLETLSTAINILNKKNLDYSVIVKDKIKKEIKNLYPLVAYPSYSMLGLIYRNADAVILPHKNISQSITLFEAGYFKKPVIVSKTGGLKETVRHGKDGFIFEKDSPTSLADKMEGFIDMSSNQIEKMGENFKDHLIKEYSWDNITEKLIKIYLSFSNL
ncbi:glycosyltransferase family 4 protein [candidate division WOR-3 bacterium]|nr:glycosyltransferase family 4 protein [candidate division WOR-3 bacterium]